jgi:superfamily II DNA or RNA helicase
VRPRSSLYRFQEATAIRVAGAHETVVLLPVGYGKTASILTALKDRNLWPALVVAPARVARHVWKAEAAEWEHLKDLIVTPLGGGDRRRRLLQGDSHVETISYEALVGQPDREKNPYTGLTDEVRLEERYKAIVFDELSKMKDPGTKRFRRIRAHAEGVPFRIGLTGTPIGNHLLDLWGEMFMITGEKSLGPTYSGFRERYFYAKIGRAHV